MVSVIISIRPQWCKLIANGEKTIEVRKTRPKIKTPFKCYIYCTSYKNPDDILQIGDKNSNIGNSKVIGEFTCDDISGGFLISPFSDHIQKQTCLTYEELKDYGKNKSLRYWHISDLKIYDEPKELSDFIRLRKTKFGYAPVEIKKPPQSWYYGRYGND